MIKLSGESCRSTRLCVNSYERGVMKGRCYNAGLEGGCMEFESLAQFLTSAEALFDASHFPQSFTAKRSFAPPSVDLTPGRSSDPGPQTGQCGTFIIRLLFRQHASWQGSVTWIEGGGEQAFRSVLELILLLDSALGGCREEPV